MSILFLILLVIVFALVMTWAITNEWPKLPRWVNKNK
jgi:hypothetical protein